jgi:hypothetical protein
MTPPSCFHFVQVIATKPNEAGAMDVTVATILKLLKGLYVQTRPQINWGS